MEKVNTTPDSYIKSLPDEIRPAIEKLDREISNVFKGAARVLWKGTFWGGSEQNIIGYGDYRYERKGKIVDWFYVGLAVQKNYLSLYVNAVQDNKYLSQTYGDQLGKVKVGASSVSFKQLEDVDLPKLLEMLRKAKALLKSTP